MGMFTVISTDAFDALQVDAGVILTDFDPSDPWKPIPDANILMTTTGGVNPVATPEFTDYAADVDNATNNMMEFKRLTNWTCSLSCSSIKFNADNAKWALGAAEKSYLSNGVAKVVPKKDMKLEYFGDIWWVGDKANGGAYAIHILNALSTGGLSIQSSKGGKGTSAVTITGHVSLANQTAMPMEIYDIPPADADVYVNVKQTYDEHITSSITALTAEFGEELTGTLTVASGYEFDNVAIYMGGADISGMTGVWDSITGAIDIDPVTADIQIVATSKIEG